MSEEKTKTTFVTFYSFKGGVGRSMALINTAAILAGQRGFRVLVVDVDLEAPGLSYLDPSAPDESPAQGQRQLPFEAGFVDLLTDAKERGEAADLFTLSPAELAKAYSKAIDISRVPREFTDGSLHVMPAGKFDGAYAARLNALNIGQLYRDGFGEPLIRAFKKKIAESGLYHYVLVDSRTGLSDEAGMCTRDLADHLMILSGLNRQNVEGTSEFLRALRATTEGKKTIQIILSPVPNGEDELFQKREDAAKDAFKTAWTTEIDLSLQIPYHPQLALTEEPHIFRRRKGYLFDSYLAIEESMLSKLGHTSLAFYKKAHGSLRKKEHATALAELQHMIRLQGGRAMLVRLVEEIAYPDRLRARSGEEATPASITVENLSKESGGADILAFVVEWLPVGEPHAWASRGFVGKLWEVSPELADKLYLRLIEETRNDAGLLASYATFLSTKRDDVETADRYYRQAVEIDVNNAYVSRSYARFLANSREDFEGSGHFYRRALELEPEDAHNLGDYGQVLVAAGKLEEAESKLLKALEIQPLQEKGNVAELYFSLWLVARMLGSDGERWERQFKSLIVEGFARHDWSFDRMLESARGVLSAEEFTYAQALAAAFLDVEKVADLASFPRWTALEALAPNLRKAKPHRRKGTK